jgi:glycosyltransferase involved in cell wall biosynthesis
VRVVAFAYACEPERGSEPGAGWAWARMIAAFGEVTVITRANNRNAIEAILPTTPERDRLEFVYVDLPSWARFWKRGSRGIHLYYVLWQAAALRVVRRRHRSQPFDVVWHLTMANAWMGSMAPLLDLPFIYGPIGGGVKTPRRLIPMLGARGILKEAAYALLQTLSPYLNPFERLAERRARLILVQNAETRNWLRSACRDKAVVFPNAVIPAPTRRWRSRAGSSVALFAGQLVPGKAVLLAIRAMAHLPDWHLMICGAGPEEPRLRRLVCEMRLDERVTFKGWVERSELLRIMAEDVDVFLFPSLHDQSPWVLHEARAVGLPVVCLEGCGATLLATVTVRPAWPERTARRLAHGVLEASSGPRPAVERFDLDIRRRRLAMVLADAGIHVERMDAVNESS